DRFGDLFSADEQRMPAGRTARGAEYCAHPPAASCVCDNLRRALGQLGAEAWRARSGDETREKKDNEGAERDGDEGTT
ncbi:MAG: hypothetical protein WBA68_04890, partial [Alteraurantiacibacter sp.]